MIDFLHRRWYPPGVPCSHRGCLHHLSHPCEGCGRIGGRYPEPSPEVRAKVKEVLERLGISNDNPPQTPDELPDEVLDQMIEGLDDIQEDETTYD